VVLSAGAEVAGKGEESGGEINGLRKKVGIRTR